MLSFVRDHRGRDRMVGGFTQSVYLTIHAVSSNTSQCEVYSIQHFMIKFASNLRQVAGFLLVLWFPHQ
jgi:hypothetical protein